MNHRRITAAVSVVALVPVAVNNTNGAFSSEGNPEPRWIKGYEFCFYYPSLGDVQSPGQTENPANGSVRAIDRGPSRSSVETEYPLPLSDCTGS